MFREHGRTFQVDFGGFLCVYAYVPAGYVGSAGQIGQVTHYPIRSNQVCVWVDEGEKKRELVHPEVYLYILISLTLKAFNPKLYTLTINETDFLSIVVFKACFCSVKTQQKQTWCKAL